MSASDRAAVVAELQERIRPTALAAERTIAVPDGLASLFPVGGLVRGSSLAITGPGATTLALTLLGSASRSGHWSALVGIDALGWAAAARAGVDLARTVAVDQPPLARWSTVVAALVDAVDLVVVDPRHQVRAADDRRLAARCRERGAVLVRLAVPDGTRRFRWPTEADLDLSVEAGWSGLGAGWGQLDPQVLRVAPSGRRSRGSRPVEVVVRAGGVVERLDVAASGRPVLRRVV